MEIIYQYHSNYGAWGVSWGITIAITIFVLEIISHALKKPDEPKTESSDLISNIGWCMIIGWTWPVSIPLYSIAKSILIALELRNKPNDTVSHLKELRENMKLFAEKPHVPKNKETVIDQSKKIFY